MARNLTTRWGFGANHIEPSTDMTPVLSARYHFGESSSAEGFLGLDTDDTRDYMLWGVRYYRNLFLEDHMNFSLTLAGGLLSQLNTSNTAASGYLVETGLNGEFFLAGLPNLGLQLNTSLRLESPRGARIRSVFSTGFFYYF